jgi:toxin-antitoxin system PIN domain toxin
MISIDTNILLYSLNPKSVWHDRAVTFLSESLRKEEVALTELVLVELYILLRNSAVVNPEMSPDAAEKVIQQYRKHPRIMRVENAPVMDQVWEQARRTGFARRRIFDVRLALTLQHHGVTEFATANTKDFEGLGFARVWNPLLDY